MSAVNCAGVALKTTVKDRGFMKITFLGSGAADWPIEKSEDMAEFRRLSSALIDDVLLIDPGPQVIETLTESGRNVKNIQYIINTHKHFDHFCVQTLHDLEANGATFYDFSDGEIKTIGDYTVSAYKANHSTCKDAVHFIITNGEKTLFYGLDGAWLLYDEIQAIQEYKPDFAVFDATIGDIYGDYRIFEHNNLNMVLEMKKSLENYIGRFCISHMARTLHTDHKTLSKRMAEYNIITAYDGLEIEI